MRFKIVSKKNMDTHKAFKKLVNSGMQENIAETVIEVIDETRRYEFEKLVTKENLDSAILINSTELRSEIATFKTELKEEIAAVRTELKEEIASVKLELIAEIAEVRSELKEFKIEVAANFTHLKWMVGLSISLNMTIIAKMFFM